MGRVNLTSSTVYDAFKEAGATDRQAQLAGNQVRLLKRFRKQKGVDGIENLYSQLQGSIFGANQSGRFSNHLQGRRLADANRIMATALTDLRMKSQLKKLSMGALQELGFANDVDGLLFESLVNKVGSVGDDWRGPVAQALKEHKLVATTVGWQDNARFQGSVGPIISDETTQVEVPNALTGKSFHVPMKMIKSPNYGDIAAAMDIDKIPLKIGNARGDSLKEVSLGWILDHMPELMSDPSAWTGQDKVGRPTRSLRAAGVDNEIIFTAQANLMPVQGNAETVFSNNVYNYQSHTHTVTKEEAEKDSTLQEGQKLPQPRVLVLVATPDGTSMSIVGKEEADQGVPSQFYGSGDRIYFNEEGQRAQLTAKRPSKKEREAIDKLRAEGTGEAARSADRGSRMMIIQIPLVQEFPQQHRWGGVLEAAMSFSTTTTSRGVPSTGEAQVGVGPVEGDFDETLPRKLVRDAQFPIRVTMEDIWYTDGTDENIAGVIPQMAANIQTAYEGAEEVGARVIKGTAVPEPWWWNQELPVDDDDDGVVFEPLLTTAA